MPLLSYAHTQQMMLARAIMDNSPAHKVPAARKVFADNKIQHLYLPDFNPIEFAFSPFKAHLGKAGVNSIKDLENETVKAINKITADQCKNCFLAQGYKFNRSTHLDSAIIGQFI